MEQCWLCCVSLVRSREWRVKVWDPDTGDGILVDQRLCQRCSHEVAELLREKRRTAV